MSVSYGRPLAEPKAAWMACGVCLVLTGSMIASADSASVTEISQAFVDIRRGVPDNVVRHLGGSKGALLPAAPSRSVDVTLSFGPGSDLVIDGGRHGALRIPYEAITTLRYGPSTLIGSAADAARRGAPASAYPWSARAHRFKNHFLKIGFRPSADDDPETVVLGIGKSLVRPTLNGLEHRTGRAVGFEVLEACLEYKTPNECGMGSPAELKGAIRVFVDTSGSREWMVGESHDRITAALAQAQLGLKLVETAEDAEIVLAFRYVAVSRPQWRTKLAARFAEAFIAAYCQANR